VINATEADLRAAMIGGGTVTFACDGTIMLSQTVANAVDTFVDGSGHQITISGSNAVRVFLNDTNATLTLVNLIVADGFGRGGSAILNLGGYVNLSGVTFRSNTATLGVNNDNFSPQAGGGAIFNRGGVVTASNCLFTNNAAETAGILSVPTEHFVYGGAIRNESGKIELTSCVFVNNRASGGGVTSIIASTFVGDPGFGGAIHNSGMLKLDLCTFANNSAAGADGAWIMGIGTSSAVRSSPTIVDIVAHGNSNQWCRILASSSLSTWFPIATNQFDSAGMIQFQDDSLRTRVRFYRVIMP